MSDGPKIKAIVPWFGSKRTLALAIVEELGSHTMYVEPFCGSAAVLFRKPVSSHEILNDLHGGLILVAMVLASDRWQGVEANLLRILYCDRLYESYRQLVEAVEIIPPVSPAEVTGEHVRQASILLTVWWQGRNGTAGTKRMNYQMAHRHTPGGGSGPIRWQGVIQSVPAWHQRLQNVDIRCTDAYELLPKIADEEGVVIYLDPTYLRDGKNRSGSCRYQYEMEDQTGTLLEDQDDHTKLAAFAQRFKKARVVVSYYDHPRLDRLYPGWTKRKLTRQKNLHVQNRRGQGRCEAPEVLLINGPNYAGARELFT